MNCLRDVHLERAGIDYLLRAFLEQRNFFQILTFQMKENVLYKIFEFNCFFNILKVYLSIDFFACTVEMMNTSCLSDKQKHQRQDIMLLYWANILFCLNCICIFANFFADIGFRIRWYYGFLVHQCITTSLIIKKALALKICVLENIIQKYF